LHIAWWKSCRNWIALSKRSSFKLSCLSTSSWSFFVAQLFLLNVHFQIGQQRYRIFDFNFTDFKAGIIFYGVRDVMGFVDDEDGFLEYMVFKAHLVADTVINDLVVRQEGDAEPRIL